jgi:hypothetical protein
VGISGLAPLDAALKATAEKEFYTIVKLYVKSQALDTNHHLVCLRLYLLFVPIPAINPKIPRHDIHLGSSWPLPDGSIIT